jgi:lysylphosphatidylglycerol synthetase-like protein (DUF2156 family)
LTTFQHWTDILIRSKPLLIRAVALVLVAAAAIGLTAALHRLWRIDDVLGALLPFDTRLTDLLDAVTGAVAFAALALGIAERRRASWVLAIVLLTAAVPLQALVLRHPIGSALGVALLVALVLSHRSFGVRSGRRALAAVAVGLMTTASIVLLAALVGPSRVPFLAAARAVTDLAGAMAFTDVRPLAALDAHSGILDLPVTAIREMVAALALLALVSAPVRGVGAASRERMRSLATRYGHGALLPHQLGADKLAFAPPDLDAAVVFGQAGRYAVAVGDPLGASAAAWKSFEQFDTACRECGLVPTVYQASGSSRGQLSAMGFESILIGREAVVPLEDFSLAGSRRANLRHTITRAKRGGVAVEVYLDGLDTGTMLRLAPGLDAIEAHWRSTAGPQLGFTIGQFDRSALDRTALAVAFEADGAPTAFATFLPTGVDGGWALDLMRRLPGGTPGAFETCIAAAAQEMQARGATTLSLGLAPLAGLSPTSEVWEERLLARLSQRIKPWYDVSGLEFFKAKFDPVWEPRYAAARTRFQLVGLVVALLRLHVGGFGHATRAAITAGLRSTRREAH